MFHRTRRLFLRPAFPEDATAIFGFMADETTVRNLASAPWPYRLEDARRWTNRAQDHWMPSFVVTLPGEGVIGSVGLGVDEDTGIVQFGYCIATGHRGRGYASEAAKGVLDVARMLGHRRITASHFVDNPASGRVLVKAGFRPTGEIRPGYSLARGCRDPVACFEIDLGDERSGDDIAAMRQAA